MNQYKCQCNGREKHLRNPRWNTIPNRFLDSNLKEVISEGGIVWRVQAQQVDN